MSYILRSVCIAKKYLFGKTEHDGLQKVWKFLCVDVHFILWDVYNPIMLNKIFL